MAAVAGAQVACWLPGRRDQRARPAVAPQFYGDVPPFNDAPPQQPAGYPPSSSSTLRWIAAAPGAQLVRPGFP